MELADNYEDYLKFLLRGDHASCARIVRELLGAGVGIKALYTDLFTASLYQVGELWQRNRISVATEHLATAITERVMSQEVGPTLFGHDPVGCSMVVTCVANEFHQIGGRMVADLAELKGWDTCFLGANTPLPDLLTMVGEKRPDVVAFSTALISNLSILQTAIESVRERYSELPIWLGGQMFRWGGKELAQQYPLVRLFASLDEFEAEVVRIAAKNPEN